MSSVNYYILTAGISIVCFFIIWGVLHGEGEPWIPAGIAAGFILISAVVLRELVFKRSFKRNLQSERRLDYNLRKAYQQTSYRDESNRLTLERNAAVIKEIESKSKYAQSIGKIAELHLEVFEICHEYLRKSSRELEGIYPESPRYPAIINGQRKVKKLHHFHLLSWASIESQTLVQSAKVQASVNDKIENAQRALAVLETATQFYPEEESLLKSTLTVKEYIVSIKVSHWIEQAERSAFKGNNKRAINHYRDALFFLARENERTPEREVLAEKINSKIEDLRKKIK